MESESLLVYGYGFIFTGLIGPKFDGNFRRNFFEIFFFKNFILAFTGAFQFFTGVFRIYDIFRGLKFFCEYR